SRRSRRNSHERPAFQRLRRLKFAAAATAAAHAATAAARSAAPTTHSTAAEAAAAVAAAERSLRRLSGFQPDADRFTGHGLDRVGMIRRFRDRHTQLVLQRTRLAAPRDVD